MRAMDAIGWAILCGMLGVAVTLLWREHAEEERAARQYLSERIRTLEMDIHKQQFDARQKAPVA